MKKRYKILISITMLLVMMLSLGLNIFAGTIPNNSSIKPYSGSALTDVSGGIDLNTYTSITNDGTLPKVHDKADESTEYSPIFKRSNGFALTYAKYFLYPDEETNYNFNVYVKLNLDVNSVANYTYRIYNSGDGYECVLYNSDNQAVQTTEMLTDRIHALSLVLMVNSGRVQMFLEYIIGNGQKYNTANIYTTYGATASAYSAEVKTEIVFDDSALPPPVLSGYKAYNYGTALSVLYYDLKQRQVAYLTDYEALTRYEGIKDYSTTFTPSLALDSKILYGDKAVSRDTFTNGADMTAVDHMINNSVLLTFDKNNVLSHESPMVYNTSSADLSLYQYFLSCEDHDFTYSASSAIGDTSYSASISPKGDGTFLCSVIKGGTEVLVEKTISADEIIGLSVSSAQTDTGYTYIVNYAFKSDRDVYYDNLLLESVLSSATLDAYHQIQIKPTSYKEIMSPVLIGYAAYKDDIALSVRLLPSFYSGMTQQLTDFYTMLTLYSKYKGVADAEKAFESGYNNGYADGEVDGSNEGFELGFDRGYGDGYIDGNVDGYTEAEIEYKAILEDTISYYEDLASDNYDSGYDLGLVDGEVIGYDKAIVENEETAAEHAAELKESYNKGKKAGFYEGKNVATDEAYNRGLQAADTFTDAIDSVGYYLFASVNIFSVNSNTIFGFRLIEVITTFVAIVIIWNFIKKVFT